MIPCQAIIRGEKCERDAAFAVMVLVPPGADLRERVVEVCGEHMMALRDTHTIRQWPLPTRLVA